MNNLKKAFENRQYPVFIFASRYELFKQCVRSAVGEFLKTNRKMEFVLLSQASKTIRAELWKGDSRKQIAAHLRKDVVMDADVEMLQGQFIETERLVAQASRAKRPSERQVTLQKSKQMSQSRFTTIMKTIGGDMMHCLENCGDALKIDGFTIEGMGSYGVAMSCHIGEPKTKIVLKVMKKSCPRTEIAGVIASEVAALQISKTLQKIGIASKGRPGDGLPVWSICSQQFRRV